MSKIKKYINKLSKGKVLTGVPLLIGLLMVGIAVPAVFMLTKNMGMMDARLFAAYGNGSACTVNSDCTSGYCDPSTHKCAPAPPADCGICGLLPDEVCTKEHEACPFPDPNPSQMGTKTVKCYHSQACLDYYGVESFCWKQTGVPDSTYPWCPSSGPTPTIACNPYACTSAPSDWCPGFYPAGSPCWGEGNCDNCGGMDCGPCPGAPTKPAATGGGPSPTNVPPPTCNCYSAANVATAATVYVCMTFLCQPQGGVYCYGTKAPVNGTWHATCNINAGCGRSCDGASICGGICPGTAPSCAVDGGWSVCPALSCGQARICNNPVPACSGAACDPATGTCLSTDAVKPGQVGITFPVGTVVSPTLVGSPVSLRWFNNETNHALTDYYEYRVRNNTDAVWVVGAGGTGAGAGVTVAGGPATTTVSFAGTTGKVYYWQVRAVNSACAGLPAGVAYGDWSAAGYFKVRSPPSIGPLVIKNSLGTIVPVDVGSSNHICQVNGAGNQIFSNRTVNFELTVSDPDGWADIASAQLRWNGTVYDLALNAGIGNSRVAEITVVYNNTTDNNSSVFQINGIVLDSGGGTSGWVDTNRDWKVWNCQVPLSGKVFDSSSSSFGAVCNSGVGFSTPAAATMNFTSVTITGGTLATINATGVDTYSGGTLIWGKYHTVIPNLSATGEVTRWLDVSNVGVTELVACDAGNTVGISAYSLGPALRIDFSAVNNQQSWYQAAGGGVLSKGGVIKTMTPVTCIVPGCSPAVSISSASCTNGLVSGSSIDNYAGCGTCQYGIPNNWGYEGNVLSDIYGYQYFYDNYYVKTGAGLVIGSGTSMSEILSLSGGTGVVLVKGNVTVNVDNTLSTGNFLMIVASGQITVDQNVVQTEGILVGGNGIMATGTNNTQLKINGVVYAAGGNVSFSRGYVTQSDNNTSPGVLVTYRPDLIFSLPASLSKVLTSWSLGK